MRRTSANRLLFAGLVAPLGVLVAAVVTTVYLELSVIIQLAIIGRADRGRRRHRPCALAS